jgi:hypothetical protein
MLRGAYSQRHHYVKVYISYIETGMSDCGAYPQRRLAQLHQELRVLNPHCSATCCRGASQRTWLRHPGLKPDHAGSDVSQRVGPVLRGDIKAEKLSPDRAHSPSVSGWGTTQSDLASVKKASLLRTPAACLFLTSDVTATVADPAAHTWVADQGTAGFCMALCHQSSPYNSPSEAFEFLVPRVAGNGDLTSHLAEPLRTEHVP